MAVKQLALPAAIAIVDTAGDVSRGKRKTLKFREIRNRGIESWPGFMTFVL